MSDLPKFVRIHEEGPREGFQIEPGPIATERKVQFIEALAETGLKQIDCVSFVNPQKVPGMADADEVIRRVKRQPGVRYTGLWLNTRGLLRALETPADIVGSIRVTASETFCLKNTGMNHAQTLEEQRRWLEIYRQRGVPVEWGYVMTAFGCNYEGFMSTGQVCAMVQQLLDTAAEAGVSLKGVLPCRHRGLGNTPIDRTHPGRRARTLARPALGLAPARYAGDGPGQRLCGAADGRRAIRLDLCGTGRLPVRRAQGLRRQHLHRRLRVHVP